ncbi:hypothetical protein HAX54_030325, partial [Datura stramonium]|nr:hypothetical protein [Datura stramonium]
SLSTFRGGMGRGKLRVFRRGKVRDVRGKKKRGRRWSGWWWLEFTSPFLPEKMNQRWRGSISNGDEENVV